MADVVQDMSDFQRVLDPEPSGGGRERLCGDAECGLADRDDYAESGQPNISGKRGNFETLSKNG